MEHSTTVDTVGIRIEVNSDFEQREIQNEILNYIRDTRGIYISCKNYFYGKGEHDFSREYFIHCINTTIATIYTGFFTKINHTTKQFQKKFYINIKFAGLKRYDKAIDKASLDCLLRVCAYLNTRGIPFYLTELDVCIDVKCAFEHLLSVCVRRSPKTKYYGLRDSQKYNNTTYLEKIEKEKLDRAVLRAYAYDKSYKEDLDYALTRFELKLQPKYFNKYGFYIKAIEKAINRYYVMYFDSLDIKNSKIDKYNSYKNPKKREIERLGFEDYRIYADMNYIEDFIDLLQEIDEFSYKFGLY